uniref:ATP synthase F0 subunit 8 n=1 Tax=Norvellina sp. EMHAU-15062816 TaxID=2040462 RepID=A0A343KGL5_9HEMI|nr:ATP synthase F0 subunit 8 [Norvellina sp. EMHAU-15062816]
MPQMAPMLWTTIMMSTCTMMMMMIIIKYFTMSKSIKQMKKLNNSYLNWKW